MYTEERKKGSLLKDFILKLILIIIFVLLLIWLVPWPNMDSLNPLKDQIFNANLQTMKEAGISYFTTERLPEKVGDKTTLTLQKMLDLKLLVPFTDKNGDSCDVTASYVSLEKKDTEYLMKVNLKCGEEEDYILVHLGCYSYCTTDICEAKPGNTEKSTTTPKPTNKPTPSQKPTSSPTPTTSPKPTPTPTATPTVTPTPTTTPTATPKEDKLCEYKKDYSAQYSNWSAWTKNVKKTNDGVVFEKTNTKEVEDLGTEYTRVGVQNVNVQVTKPVTYQMGTYKYKVCTSYTYEADATTVYQINSDWAYVDNWYSGYNPPADTVSSRWIFQGVDFSQCGETCTDHPYVVYRQQTRQVTAYTDYSNVTANCTNIEERSIPLYGTRIISELHTVQKPYYAYVRYYRVRTRTLLKDAYTDYQWVDCDDKTLANQGWTYTGKTKNK